jgi:hypothetical protein
MHDPWSCHEQVNMRAILLVTLISHCKRIPELKTAHLSIQYGSAEGFIRALKEVV